MFDDRDQKPDAKSKNDGIPGRREWFMTYMRTNPGARAGAAGVAYAADATLNERFGKLGKKEEGDLFRKWQESKRARVREVVRARLASQKKSRSKTPASIGVARFDEAVVLAGGAPPRGATTLEASALLEAHRVPPELRAFLDDHCYKAELAVSGFNFHAMGELVRHNTDPLYEFCLYDRLLIVGSCINDDALVVDLTDMTVGYLDRDVLAAAAEPPDPRDALTSTDLGIGDFFFAAARHGAAFPSGARAAAAVEGPFSQAFPVT